MHCVEGKERSDLRAEPGGTYSDHQNLTANMPKFLVLFDGTTELAELSDCQWSALQGFHSLQEYSIVFSSPPPLPKPYPLHPFGLYSAGAEVRVAGMST